MTGKVSVKHVKFKVSSGYLGGDAVGSLELSRAVWAEDLYLGAIGIWIVFKTMSLKEIVKVMSVDIKQEPRTAAWGLHCSMCNS